MSGSKRKPAKRKAGQRRMELRGRPTQEALPGLEGEVANATQAVRWVGAKGSAPGRVQRTHGELDKVIAYFPVEVGRQLRAHCFERQRQLSSVVVEVVQAHLEGGGASSLPAELLEQVEALRGRRQSVADVIAEAVEEWCTRRAAAARRSG